MHVTVLKITIEQEAFQKDRKHHSGEVLHGVPTSIGRGR